MNAFALPDDMAEQSLAVYSDIPFRILSAQTDSNLFSVRLLQACNQPSKKQIVQVSFMPKQQQEAPFKGKIQLTVDIEGQETLLLPCSGYSLKGG